MGSKIESKKLAQANGVPVVPGYFGPEQDIASLTNKAELIGYPVLIKASAGGGGKGMRVVQRGTDFAEALQGAKREAQAAFGDDSVLLEKYLDRPRHIEVQVIGDLHGNLIHLGERDCSIQRRHQKVVEECPSPALNPEQRDRITAAAVTLAGAAGYSSAGTIEFLFQDEEFYFLEMNTRLQVEHPVTEEVVGLDLVELQIRFATGEKLNLRQEDVQFRGHAIETRLYAEDPDSGFLPATGIVREFSVRFRPPGLRIDAGVESGDVVSPNYDPMIAKLIATGPDRATALAAIASTLGAVRLQGLTTNVEFLRWLVSHPSFQAGEFSTQFIEEYYTARATHYVQPEIVLRAALHLVPDYSPNLSPEGDVWQGSLWRQASVGMPIRLDVDGKPFRVEVDRSATNGTISVRLSGDSEAVLEHSRPSTNGDTLVSATTFEDTRFGAHADEGVVILQDRAYYATIAQAPSTDSMEPVVHLGGEDSLESPMPGTILKIMIGPEVDVAEGQALAIVEAMKMEFTIRAPHEGRIKKVNYGEGAQVASGDILIEMYPPQLSARSEIPT
jgi:3-methylcrotonyl-CoA carboxylase alpha subunit